MNGGNAVEQIPELGQFFFLFQKQNGHRFVKRHGRDDIEQVEEEFVPHSIPCQRASHQEHEQETQQPCDNKVHGCPVSLSGFIDFALQFDDQVLFQDVSHLRLRIRPEIVELQRQIQTEAITMALADAKAQNAALTAQISFQNSQNAQTAYLIEQLKTTAAAG